MKSVKKLGELLTQPTSPITFEIHHQFKILKIEVEKLKAQLSKSHNDRIVMEHHLNSTIEDLSNSNLKIRELRRNELAENEKKRKFQDSKLEQITNSMTSSMAFVDTNFTYRYINNKYTEWFGVERENIVGKTIEEVAGKAFFEMYKPMYGKIFSGESFTTEMDTKIANTDKRLVCKASYVPAYDMDGKNIGVYIYGTDITENKEKEEEIQKSKSKLAKTNAKLKEYIESNVQLEHFAYIAAHDMKAPMRSISSFTSLLSQNLADKLSEKELDYFQYVKTGTKRLSNLITDLLNYSKVGEHKLELSEVNFKELVEQVIRYLEVTVRESKAIVVIPEDLPELAIADRIKIYQVFQNLISNSIKFTKPGTIPQIELKYSQNDFFHYFSVMDNGIGMDNEHLCSIFESFKQLNSKSEYEGTGLGLSICKKIVEHHGGDITVESKLGEGSTFTFSIPKKLVIEG